jgi:hypothetical protein
VTYRIDAREDFETLVLEVQGLLDRKALSDLRERCAAPVLRGLSVRLVLRLGTEVEFGGLEELAGLQGVEVVAEAPFLKRWLERRSEQRKRSRRS